MPYFLRLHKVQDSWGSSLGRCGGNGLELCCESGVSSGVEGIMNLLFLFL